jgi:hypothetical protein
MKRYFSTLFACGLIALLIGTVGLAATWFWQRSIITHASSFKPVQATMLKCRMLMLGNAFSLIAQYEYQVGQRTFTSTKVERFPGADCGATSDFNYWESLEKRFEKGNIVKAWYNPDNPAEAYLLNNTSFTLIYVLYVFAGMVILTGVILQVTYLIKRII